MPRVDEAKKNLVIGTVLRLIGTIIPAIGSAIVLTGVAFYLKGLREWKKLVDGEPWKILKKFLPIMAAFFVLGVVLLVYGFINGADILVLAVISFYPLFIAGGVFSKNMMLSFYRLTGVKYFKIAGRLYLYAGLTAIVAVGIIVALIAGACELMGYVNIPDDLEKIAPSKVPVE